MDPLEGTLYGRLSTDLTSELTHFNPGIRLRKGKQSAFFRVSHCRCRGVEQRAAVPGLTILVELQPLSNKRNLLYSWKLKHLATYNATCKASGMSFSCRYCPLGFFGEVSQLCTQFVKTGQLSHALFGLTDHGPVMGIACDYSRVGLNPN